ncbi:hypothetical protein ACFW1M_44115 [Streptomyces inhibens]|uniref:hypothetical protein n=1 Tax=Streptomyces inhibens TaxID=2293571 RepID=UPI00367F75EB
MNDNSSAPAAPSEHADPLFVTGLYSNGHQPARIAVYHATSATKPLWSWSPATDPTLHDAAWKELRESTSVTEVKWADGGSKVLALVGDHIVLIAVPDQDRHEPVLLFATRLQNASNAHSVEILPDNLIAVADNGHDSGNSGVQLYSVGDQRMGSGKYEQQLRYFPSTHGLLWDSTRQWLWVVGNTKWPQSAGAQGLLRAYVYNPSTRRLEQEHIQQQNVGTGQATKEDSCWWDSPHDITGVPKKRQLLITTEEDVYTCDIGYDVEAPVRAAQLAAFISHSHDRTNNGYPRSRFKAIGMRASGEIIYTQPSKWGRDQDYPDMIGHYQAHTIDDVIRTDSTTYKARWFEPTPGWDTPKIHTPPPPAPEHGHPTYRD